jgi:hypothetical protein
VAKRVGNASGERNGAVIQSQPQQSSIATEEREIMISQAHYYYTVTSVNRSGMTEVSRPRAVPRRKKRLLRFVEVRFTRLRGHHADKSISVAQASGPIADARKAQVSNSL